MSDYKGYYIEETPAGYKVYSSREAWVNGEDPIHSAESLVEAKLWVDLIPGRPAHPSWTVVSNIVSPESDKWVGTCWEFFDEERQAEECYTRQIEAGNTPVKRPYFEISDRGHLGAVHRRSS